MADITPTPPTLTQSSEVPNTGSLVLADTKEFWSQRWLSCFCENIGYLPIKAKSAEQEDNKLFDMILRASAAARDSIPTRLNLNIRTLSVDKGSGILCCVRCYPIKPSLPKKSESEFSDRCILSFSIIADISICGKAFIPLLLVGYKLDTFLSITSRLLLQLLNQQLQ